MQLFTKPWQNHPHRLRLLRRFTLGFLLVLMTPLAILLFLGYQQLEKDAIAIYEKESNALIIAANRKFYQRLTLSNNLPITAFDYSQPTYNPLTQRMENAVSPLSSLDIQQLGAARNIAGLVGYFQFAGDGKFNSPVYPLPLSSDIRKMTDNPIEQHDHEIQNELTARENVAARLHQILRESKAIEELLQQGLAQKDTLFKVIFDLTEYFVFYRVISLGQAKRLQGYLVERKPYMQRAFIGMLERRRFDNTVLIELQDTKPSHHIERFLYENTEDGQAKINREIQDVELWQQQQIIRTKLAYPFRNYQVTLSTSHVPTTEAMLYGSVFSLALIGIIMSACYGFYRLGVSQLALAEQRLNFVSAVSHELKTPLTAIRMYAEMLQQGAVMSKQHQQDYFTFISSESERLTRLINNILRLTQLNNQPQKVVTDYIELTTLQDIIRAKTLTTIENQGFHQNIILAVPNPEKIAVLVEQDAFAQIIINITDNAIKFFDKNQITESERQVIDYTFRLHPHNEQLLQLDIRDYGQGINREQEDQIFELFYRGGSELTRKTQGTGIGLALVRELVNAQQGTVRAIRKNPGLAIQISFKCKIAQE